MTYIASTDNKMPLQLNTVKDLGAVFTPPGLVNTMLDTLPDDLFANPSKKWLEPCVGDGQFVKEILQRATEAIDLTCIEIHRPFCDIFSKTTGIPVINTDFLEFKTDTKYDVIIGNPPYQKPNKKTQKARGGKSQLYMEFMERCLDILSPGGYLLFVHPSNWRKIGSPILHRILNTMTIRLLCLHQKKIFPNIPVTVDWYLIQNTPPLDGTKTKIINSDNSRIEMVLDRSLPFIPNQMSDDIQNTIFELSKGHRHKVILSCELHAYTKKHLISKTKSRDFRYPLVNTSAQGHVYSKVKHSYQNHKKVILSNSGNLSPFYDDGVLGTTQNSMFILVKNQEEGENIVEKLKSEKYQTMIKICQWGLFRTERALVEYFGF